MTTLRTSYLYLYEANKLSEEAHRKASGRMKSVNLIVERSMKSNEDLPLHCIQAKPPTMKTTKKRKTKKLTAPRTELYWKSRS